MSQEIIRNQLALFLKINSKLLAKKIKATYTSPEREIKLTELDNYINKCLHLLIEGHCFGLALCEAVFEHFGYGNWWRQLLCFVHNCDLYEPHILDKNVDLSPFLPSAEQSNACNRKPTTARDLFERCLNYIVWHQVGSELPQFTTLNKYTQGQMLTVNNPFFEIQINNEIKRIRAKKSLAGNLNINLLTSVLNKNKQKFATHICMVHSEVHSINIKYHTNQWHLYDSNYSHETTEEMIHSFDTPENLINEIYLQLETKNILIDLISFTYKPSSYLINELKVDEIMQLLNHEGLHYLAQQTPFVMSSLLRLATQHSKLAQAITDNLMAMNNKKETGLYYLVNYAHASLPELFELAQNYLPLFKILPSLFLLPNELGQTMLHVLAWRNHASLSSLLNFSQKYSRLSFSIATALKYPDQDNQTGLHALAIRHWGNFPLLFKLAKTRPELCYGIANALKSTNTDGWTGLHTMGHFVPKTILKLIDLCSTSPILYKAFAASLTLFSAGEIGLKKFIDTTPTALRKLLKCILINSKHDKETPFHTIARFNSLHLTTLFNAADKQPQLKPYLAKILFKRNSLNETVEDLIYWQGNKTLIAKSNAIIDETYLHKIEKIINASNFWSAHFQGRKSSSFLTEIHKIISHKNIVSRKILFGRIKEYICRMQNYRKCYRATNNNLFSENNHPKLLEFINTIRDLPGKRALEQLNNIHEEVLTFEHPKYWYAQVNSHAKN